MRLIAPRVVAVGSLCGLLLVGCAGPAPAPAPPSPASPAAPAGPVPLTPDQRVVQGDLAGMQSPAGVKTATTKEAYIEAQLNPRASDYAEERGGDIALLADRGFVAGAAKLYAAKSTSGLSVAAQLGSPEQALAYEHAMYDEEFGGGRLTSGAQKGTVAGSAVSHTVIDDSTEDGATFSHVWASFVDGPFVYLQEAEGQGASLNAQAVIDAANALFTKVKGAPAS